MKENSNERAYFAAVNSGEGFVGFFDEIFYAPEITRRYIIKGGPGTGKSSFMRRVAMHAQMKGREVCYYYCSSDTDSLDGIVIDGRTAFLDGTSPHACETVLAGACDELINLGAFWDREKLVGQRERLYRLVTQKKTAYCRAYRYLAAAKAIGAVEKSYAEGITDRAKLLSAVARVSLKQCAGAAVPQRAQVAAFGTRGRVRLDTLRAAAREIYAVEDYYGAGRLYMAELKRACAARGTRMLVSYDTVDQSVPDEMLLCDSGELFRLCAHAGEGERAVSCARFVRRDSLCGIRSSFRAARQARNAALSLAESELAYAGRIHAETEGIYVGAMDFSGVQRMCDQIIKDVL